MKHFEWFESDRLNMVSNTPHTYGLEMVYIWCAVWCIYGVCMVYGMMYVWCMVWCIYGVYVRCMVWCMIWCMYGVWYGLTYPYGGEVKKNGS